MFDELFQDTEWVGTDVSLDESLGSNQRWFCICS